MQIKSELNLDLKVKDHIHTCFIAIGFNPVKFPPNEDIKCNQFLHITKAFSISMTCKRPIWQYEIFIHRHKCFSIASNFAPGINFNILIRK